jgi:hypothetical protein
MMRAAAHLRPFGGDALFGFFRRPPPIRDVAALGDFIDRHAAFVAQKGVYEYSRARAGHYAKVLFKEKEFQHAVEVARWRAYPLGLAMVAELVHGILRPHAGDRHGVVHAAVVALALDAFDRYPVPAALGDAAWSELRDELRQRLNRIDLHPPKFAKDIPEPFAQAYFSLMPIHQKLRTSEFPTIRNYLRVSLINVHDELSKRMDASAMAALLSAG